MGIYIGDDVSIGVGGGGGTPLSPVSYARITLPNTQLGATANSEVRAVLTTIVNEIDDANEIGVARGSITLGIGVWKINVNARQVSADTNNNRRQGVVTRLKIGTTTISNSGQNYSRGGGVLLGVSNTHTVNVTRPSSIDLYFVSDNQQGQNRGVYAGEVVVAKLQGAVGPAGAQGEKGDKGDSGTYDDRALAARVAQNERDIDALEARPAGGGTPYNDREVRRLITNNTANISAANTTISAANLDDIQTGDVGHALVATAAGAADWRPIANDVRVQRKIRAVSSFPVTSEAVTRLALQDDDFLVYTGANVSGIPTSAGIHNLAGNSINAVESGDVFSVISRQLRRVGNILRHDGLEQVINNKSQISTGARFPASPRGSDIHIFTVAAASVTWEDEHGTALASANTGDVAYWTGTAWRRVGNLSPTDSRDQATAIADIRSRILDLIQVNRLTWSNSLPTGANLARFVYNSANTGRVLNGQLPTGAIDWQTSFTMPANSNAFFIVRLPISGSTASTPQDFRLIGPDGFEVPVEEMTLISGDGGNSYYAIIQGTGSGRSVRRITLGGDYGLQHHGNEIHTRFIGDLLPSAVGSALLETTDHTIYRAGGAVDNPVVGVQTNVRASNDLSNTTAGWGELTGGSQNPNINLNNWRTLNVEYEAFLFTDDLTRSAFYYASIPLARISVVSAKQTSYANVMRNVPSVLLLQLIGSSIHYQPHLVASIVRPFEVAALRADNNVVQAMILYRLVDGSWAGYGTVKTTGLQGTIRLSAGI